MLNLAQSDKANCQFRKKVNFEIEATDRIFLHPMVYIYMVGVNTIITLGFYQLKRVLASLTIMGLKCKPYLEVRLMYI